MKYNKEFKHELLESFTYCDKQGELQEANLITVKAPNGKMIKTFNSLKALYNKSQAKLSDSIDFSPEKIQEIQKALKSEEMQAVLKKSEAVQNEDADSKANSIVNQLMAYLEDSDINKAVIVLKDVLKANAVVDNEIKFADLFFEEMSCQDLNLILGKYIENFMQ